MDWWERAYHYYPQINHRRPVHRYRRFIYNLYHGPCTIPYCNVCYGATARNAYIVLCSTRPIIAPSLHTCVAVLKYLPHFCGSRKTLKDFLGGRPVQKKRREGDTKRNLVVEISCTTLTFKSKCSTTMYTRRYTHTRIVMSYTRVYKECGYFLKPKWDSWKSLWFVDLEWDKEANCFTKKKKKTSIGIYEAYIIYFLITLYDFLVLFPSLFSRGYNGYVNNCKGRLSPVISCRIFSFAMWIANNSNIAMKFIGCSNTRVFHTGREIITRYIYYQTSAIIIE